MTPADSARGGPPRLVGDVLAGVLRDAGYRTRRPASGIAQTWAAAAGPEVAAETRPATLRRGVLTVEVRSAALLAELKGFRTQELLARLLAQDPSGRITGLAFRPGVF